MVRKFESLKVRKFLSYTGLVALIALVISSVALSAPVKVFLKPETQVACAEPIKLRDVATIIPAASTLGDMVIGYGPTPGAKRTLDSGFIKMKLNGTAAGTEFLVQGPSTIAVSGKCVRLSPQVLTDEAKNLVTEHLPQDGRTYDVTVERMPSELVIPDKSGVEMKPRLVLGTVRPGPNSVAMEARANGRLIASTSVFLRVTATADVMIATTAIRKGDPVNSTNTTWESRDITRLKNIITSTEWDQATDRVAARLITPGKVISPLDVALPPAIKRGDAVKFTVRCGQVTLHTTAEARQDGCIGESISVRSSISKEDIRARITAPGEVEIKR